MPYEEYVDASPGPKLDPCVSNGLHQEIFGI